jgi:lysophospholipase L1-like esterase
MPKFLKLTLLTLLSIVFAFLMVEALLRVYFYRWNHDLSVPFLLFSRTYPESDVFKTFFQESKAAGVIFELKPNLNVEYLGHPFRTNSQGILGEAEIDQAKDPQVFRIAGVGDSVMTSWGVDPSHTYLAQLEKRLNESGLNKKIEIINFAVPGYNTAQELAVIKEKVLDYHPDLIIIGFVNNDLDLPNSIRSRIEAKSYALLVITKVLLKNDKLEALHYTFFDAEAGKFLMTEETPPEYEYMVGEENYFKNMEKIKTVTSHQEVPVLVIGAAMPQLEAMGFYRLDTYDLYLKELETKNIAQRDTVVNFEQGDLHFNQLGHQLQAGFLFDYLSQNKNTFALD